MATEDLVPRGLPQGGRQQVQAAMAAADLPTDSEQAVTGPAPVAAPAAAPPATGTIPAQQQMQGFDVFNDRAPSPVPAPDQRDVIDAQVRASANAVMQEVFSRMSGYREG